MLLYENMIDPDDFKKISLRSLKFLTQELRIFLSFYEKDILLVTPEEVEAFEQLKKISDLLNQGRYDLLINNPDIMIDFTDDDDSSYLPSYYPY